MELFSHAQQNYFGQIYFFVVDLISVYIKFLQYYLQKFQVQQPKKKSNFFSNAPTLPKKTVWTWTINWKIKLETNLIPFCETVHIHHSDLKSIPYPFFSSISWEYFQFFYFQFFFSFYLFFLCKQVSSELICIEWFITYEKIYKTCYC